MDQSIPAFQCDSPNLTDMLLHKAATAKPFFKGLSDFKSYHFWLYLPKTSNDIKAFIKKGITKFGGSICLSFSSKVKVIVIADSIFQQKNPEIVNVKPQNILAGHSQNSSFYLKQHHISKQTYSKLNDIMYAQEESDCVEEFGLDNVLPNMSESDIKFIFASTLCKIIELLDIDTIEWHKDRGLNVPTEKKAVFALSSINISDISSEFALFDLSLSDTIHYYHTDAPLGTSIFQTALERSKLQPEKGALDGKYHEKIERQLKKKTKGIFYEPKPSQVYCWVCSEHFKETYVEHIKSIKHKNNYLCNIAAYEDINEIFDATAGKPKKKKGGKRYMEKAAEESFSNVIYDQMQSTTTTLSSAIECSLKEEINHPYLRSKTMHKANQATPLSKVHTPTRRKNSIVLAKENTKMDQFMIMKQFEFTPKSNKNEALYITPVSKKPGRKPTKGSKLNSYKGNQNKKNITETISTVCAESEKKRFALDMDNDEGSSAKKKKVDTGIYADECTFIMKMLMNNNKRKLPTMKAPLPKNLSKKRKEALLYRNEKIDRYLSRK